MTLPSILVVQLVALTAVFQGMASYPAYADKDDQLLLHIPKGHVVSITFQNKEGPLSGCWQERHNVGGRWLTGNFIIHQEGSGLKAWSVQRRDQVYHGQVNGTQLLLEYQMKNADDFRGQEDWHNTETGVDRPRPSLQMAQKILASVGQHPIYSYHLDIVDQATLTGQMALVEYSHDGAEFLSARMRTLASKWQRQKSVPVKSVKFLGDHASSTQPIVIQAQADSNCDIGLDRAEVRLYPGHDKDKGITVELVETAPESNILKSAPVSIPADWKADFIRLQAGFRGAKIPLTGASSSSTAASKQQTDAARDKARQRAVLEDHLEKLSDAGGELDSLREQWKIYSDQIEEQRAKGNDVTNLLRNQKQLTGKIQQARKKLVVLNKKYGTPGDIEKKLAALKPVQKKTPRPKSDPEITSPSPRPGFSFSGIPNPFGFGAKPPAAGKGKGKSGAAGKGRGIPPVPGGGAPPVITAAKCPEKSPDPECWTDDQLQTETQRLKTLYRRINGGEGVMIYKRSYKMPDDRLVTRLEIGEDADYTAPYSMTSQSRFIRKKTLLDALRQAKSKIEARLDSRKN